MGSKDEKQFRMSGPVLDLSHVEIEVPNYEDLKQQRIGRNRQAMEAADKRLAKEIFPQADKSSLQTKSAICLQRMWRGVMGRKRYVDLLYEQYEKEYQQGQEKTAKQMKEGELLVDNRELERCLVDGHTVRRNRTRHYVSNVITIQRAWRQYHRHKVKDQADAIEGDAKAIPTNPNISSNDGVELTNPVPTIVITDDHNSTATLTTATPTITINRTCSITTSDCSSNTITTTTTTNNNQTATTTKSNTSTPTTTTTTGNLATSSNTSQGNGTTSTTATTSDLDRHLQPVHHDHDNEDSLSSGHEDEPSETESTIGGHAMTDLTPEENQGGEAQISFPTSTPSDSIEGQDDQPSLAVGAGDQGSSTTPEPEPEQGSGGVYLDASKVLLGLERDRISPRRYSVDVECDSVTSDYSELGGTLKDIEKDVCFLDRDSLLNTYGVGEEGDDQYPLGPGFSLAQLGLRRGSSSSDLINNTTTPAEKQDNETEADFQKRLRKVSILSLAQEFALLKKVDSQACPIYFHRVNKSKSFRHSATPSPVSSRCQSVERSCRRTVSRSPHRSYDSGKRNQLTATAMDTAIQKLPPPASSPASLSKNHKGATNQTVQDLPTNEARRKHSSGSDDLPANMRPERRIIMQHQHENEEAISPTSPPPPSVQPSDSSATSSCLSQGHNNDDTTTTNSGVKPDVGEDNGDGGDGAFDVYNIENAMPANLDWKTLQQHMERHESDGKTRLQVCTN